MTETLEPLKTDRYGNRYAPARTLVEIKGMCIDTIPAGTVFYVQTEVKDFHRNEWHPADRSLGYTIVLGLGVSSVYNNEYEFITL